MLRPSRYAQTFTVQQQTMQDDPSGGIGYTEAWTSTGVTVRGVLSQLTPDEQTAYQQAGHNVTQTIVAAGPRYSGAKPNDRLLLGTRLFYVRLIEDPAARGALTIYRVEETPGGA